MESLEIELAVLLELINEETEKLIGQYFHWQNLQVLAPIYGLNLGAYKLPESPYETHVLERAKCTFSKKCYKALKRTWCSTDALIQIALVNHALSYKGA